MTTTAAHTVILTIASLDTPDQPPYVETSHPSCSEAYAHMIDYHRTAGRPAASRWIDGQSTWTHTDGCRDLVTITTL